MYCVMLLLARGVELNGNERVGQPRYHECGVGR